MEHQKMTAQEIFDTVSKHLLSMNKRAGKEETNSYGALDFMCMYRDPDGGKCAFGVLIPDDLYSEEMERRTAFSLLTNGSGGEQKLQDLFYEHCDLIMALQNVHDLRINWDNGKAGMQQQLRRVAQKYDLEFA